MNRKEEGKGEPHKGLRSHPFSQPVLSSLHNGVEETGTEASVRAGLCPMRTTL